MVLLLFFTISVQQQSCISGYKVLGLFPLTVKSHYIMFEQLLKGLSRKGHVVHVVSPYKQDKPHPNYTDLVEFDIGMPHWVNNFTYQGAMSIGQSFPVLYVTGYSGYNVCEGLALPGLQKLIRETPRDSYDVVLTQVEEL